METCVSGYNMCFPLVGLRSSLFRVGPFALKVVTCKGTKHEKTCIDNQHAFVPFAFGTFGFFANEPMELLNQVQRVMHNFITNPRFMNIVF